MPATRGTIPGTVSRLLSACDTPGSTSTETSLCFWPQGMLANRETAGIQGVFHDGPCRHEVFLQVRAIFREKYQRKFESRPARHANLHPMNAHRRASPYNPAKHTVPFLRAPSSLLLQT